MVDGTTAASSAELRHPLGVDAKGEIDVAIGYFPALAQKNFRQMRVDTQRFACLMRADHPLRSDRLSVADFRAAEHIVIRSEGRSQEVVERFFERRRISRRVVVFTPHFLSVPFIVAKSDLIATVPRSVALEFASMIPQLTVASPPFDITGFDLKLHWHRRFDNEPRSRWLREQLATVFRKNSPLYSSAK